MILATMSAWQKDTTTCAWQKQPSTGKSSTGSIAPIRRLGTDDPRMLQIVVHNGVVHMSGQVDVSGKTAEDQTRACLAKVCLPR